MWLIFMVTKFSVFGSCASRDIFYSRINLDYKKYFSIDEDGIRISFISLMQNPVNYQDYELDLPSNVPSNINKSNWIKKDLNKSFLEILTKNDIEYLIIDTYYDTNWGILEFEDINNQLNYITNNPGLTETIFYKNLKNKRFLTIHKDTEFYFKLWKENCNKFFEYVHKNCPNLKIILNPVRDVYNVLTKDGNIIESDSFKKVAMSNNKYRILFDKYICSNFNVDVLYFDPNVLADENHIWGLSSFHYDSSYFTDITNQLINIINRDKTENKEICDKIKLSKRNEALLNFNNDYLK